MRDEERQRRPRAGESVFGVEFERRLLERGNRVLGIVEGVEEVQQANHF